MNMVVVSNGTRTSRKLDSFQNLQPGWHYGGGGPIPIARIIIAKKILQFMQLIGFSRTDAFASVDLEVLLSAYHGQNYLGVVVEAEDTFSFTHEFDGQECCSADSIALLETKKFLLKVAGEIWPTSALSTHGIMTPFVASLTNSRFGNRPTAECLSSIEAVQNQQVA